MNPIERAEAFLKTQDLPAITEALSVIFPDQVPNITDTDRDVWIKVGHVRVVRYLKRLAEDPLRETEFHTSSL